MKALLYKDFIVMKKEIIMTVVILLIYIPLTIIMQNEYIAVALIGITSGLVAMFPNYSFVHDPQNSWEGYLCATPVSRKIIVLEKFLLLLLAMPLLLLGILTVAVCTAVTLSGTISLVLICATMIFGFIQIPLYFILGPNKARIIMMFAFFIVFYGIIMLLLNDQFGGVLPAESVLAVLLGGLTVVTLPAAFLISLAALQNKEF